MWLAESRHPGMRWYCFFVCKCASQCKAQSEAFVVFLSMPNLPRLVKAPAMRWWCFFVCKCPFHNMSHNVTTFARRLQQQCNNMQQTCHKNITTCNKNFSPHPTTMSHNVTKCYKNSWRCHRNVTKMSHFYPIKLISHTLFTVEKSMSQNDRDTCDIVFTCSLTCLLYTSPSPRD